MLTRAIFFACGLLICAASFATNAAAKLTATDKQAVVVSVTQNTAAEFLITVDLYRQRYRFATFIENFESPTEGLSHQRTLMGWKGDYLFVRHQCGQVANWRCIVDQVFTVDRGKLIHLGEVESASCQSLGCRYQITSGEFNDIFDIYQVNPVTGATDAPPLSIVRRVVANKLVTDIEATWQRNQANFAASIACLDKVAATGFSQPCDNKLVAWSALVYAAKLTHYTKQFSARDALLANQAIAYCRQSADPKCQWRVDGVKDFFQRFAPGDNPANIPSPVTLTTVSANDAHALKPEKFNRPAPIKLKL
jgi:hypothetical protein